jgi:hypothetical protein
MSTVEELERELVIHRDIYEIARDKLIDTEVRLEMAIAEEEELKRNSDRARRFLCFAAAGVAIAIAVINVWG